MLLFCAHWGLWGGRRGVLTVRLGGRVLRLVAPSGGRWANPHRGVTSRGARLSRWVAVAVGASRWRGAVALAGIGRGQAPAPKMRNPASRPYPERRRPRPEARVILLPNEATHRLVLGQRGAVRYWAGTARSASSRVS
jgi:hypothetical protein